MSKIGKRIKSVILKGKTFWNWKKEDGINVNIPVPKDYRNKVSYETNVEFVFNREVIASFSYNDPSQIPSMDDLIPAGYKLLYDNENTIQPYNNNRYVLVYDYYDLIVHYRNASDPNTDIKVYKGRYQYGTLITANMIDWPAGKNGKEEWIEFPIGELTPARVTDKYVYFTNGSSSSPTEQPVSNSMRQGTSIQINVHENGQEYDSSASFVIPQGYIDNAYLQKYIKGRLPLGVNPNTDFSVNVRKGEVNIFDISSKARRIPETPQAYYVGRNVDIRTTQYVHEGNARTRFEIVPIIWYDEEDPAFNVFKTNNMSELKTFFDNHITRMRNEFISGNRIPGGTYAAPFNSTTKMNNILINSYKIFEINGMPPFIYMMNRGIFNFDEERPYPFTPAIFNIGNALTDFENGGSPNIVNYYKNGKYTINTDIVNQNFRYKRIENFSYDGKNGDLCVYLVPLRRMKYIGLYLGDKNGNMYRNYYANVSASNLIISNELMNDMYGIIVNANNIIHDGLKKTTYKELKNAVGKTGYDQFKSADGDRFSLSNNYTTKYMHRHRPNEINTTQTFNSALIAQTVPIDETSILIEHKSAISRIADDVTQKYRIHFFDETGSEMKHYYTDQIIKEGTPPSPYPPRGYIVDPNKPWTRNPDNNKEIYVYLKKKICRVIVKATVSNPSNIKNKYWNAILGDNILLDTNKYVGEKINPATLFEGFKNTHSAKLKSVQIEDSTYNSMAELEIEDSITITFNFKIFKTDSMKSVFKLSEARREFGILNPYFDYKLFPILVKPEALKPVEVFEREEKTRTTNLIWYKDDLSNLHLDPKAGALETNIVYDLKENRSLLNSNLSAQLDIKIYTIKDGIKKLVYSENNMSLANVYGKSTSAWITGGYSAHNNAIYKSIANKIGGGFSNIGHFFIDTDRTFDARDAFRIFFANSPDFIEENIDLEVEIEWSNELLDYRHNGKYPVDIRLIPSAIAPSFSSGGAIVNTPVETGYSVESLDATNVIRNNKATFSPGRLVNHRNFDYDKTFEENAETYMNSPFILSHESLKLTNIDMFIGTYGFTSRPWSILQLLPRPIPIMRVLNSYTPYNNRNIEDQLPETRNYKSIDGNVFTVKNRNASEIFSNKIIYNCFYNKFTNEEIDVSDDFVVIDKGLYESRSRDISNRYVSETVLTIKNPKIKDIILKPTNIDSNEQYAIYGATSVEDWFKVVIELSASITPPTATIYADAYMNMLIEHTSYNDDISYIPEIHANPKGYKAVDFSYVKQDTEHPYINTSLFEDPGITRYIFHPKPSNISNRSLVRNYLEDGRVMKTYVSSTGEVIKTIENSAYKGYLEGKPKFVDYVVSEISFASKLYNHKEFYFISAGLYESKEAALATNKTEYMPNDRVGYVFDKWKTIKGYKDLVDKGEIVKYPADKGVFDKDSVIKLIYSGNNYHAISDIRHLKWHAIEEDNATVVLDFERKYALDFVTPYSRNIIIPDLDKLIDYVFDRGNYSIFLVSDSSTWMEPALQMCGGFEQGEEYIDGVGITFFPDKNPQPQNSNIIYYTDNLATEITQSSHPYSKYHIEGQASKLYYALLMHDIYNNKKDDGYAVKQELYNPDDIIKYKYVRYPDNDAIDKFVNIHMYNNTVVSSDGETAIHLKASRFDYRFHPGSIHVKIFGYNMYDLLFKATSIVDLRSNDPSIEQYANEMGAMNYNIVYRWKLDNDVAAREGRRFNYSIGLLLTEELKSIRSTNVTAYLKDTNKQLSTIAPNIFHNFGMLEVNKYSHYLNTGDIYRPVMFNDDDTQGLNFKNSPANTFYVNENRTFMNHSTNNEAYKLINPYALLERNDGTGTGITFEDIFRKAWDPYTGHRFTGKSMLMSKSKYLYITNLYNHYADPYNITTNWMLRVSKNSIHFGGAWSDERLVNDPSLIVKTLNLIEQGLPQDPISAGSERYSSGLNQNHPIIINQFTSKNQAVAEHPMNIRYMCHPFQRTCLVLIRLVTDNPAARNTEMDTINLPVYMGYVNIRYEEINKRKHDINLLKAYIKECALREDSGYKYYLKNFKYPYVFNQSTNRLFAFDVLENDPLDIIVTYTEDHNSANPSYQFSAEFVLRAHIIGEDAKKPENADICDNKALQHQGSNAIIQYIHGLKMAGAITKRVGDNNLSNEEFYDAIKFLSTHSLEKIEAAPKYNIPEYFVHKYSIFNGVKRFGWSAYNGQYLPKWPAFIPDNVTMLVSQNLLLIKDTVNVTSLSYNPTIKPFRLLNTNMMLHPNFIGGIKDKKNEYVKFDSTKFYGSINVADVSELGESFNKINPKLTGFEYYSNRIYDVQRPGKERAHATMTEVSGMALQSYYIKYTINAVASVPTKWFKQRAYDQIHEVFMHKEEYAKPTIHESVPATTTPQNYLNKVYGTLEQPSLSSKGVSNFNLWDDSSSIGFRMDLNPSSINIVYPKTRYAPTAIQWNFPMIFRRDTTTDFYRQRKYWTVMKNYEINEIAFNPHPGDGDYHIASYTTWK